MNKEGSSQSSQTAHARLYSRDSHDDVDQHKRPHRQYTTTNNKPNMKWTRLLTGVLGGLLGSGSNEGGNHNNNNDDSGNVFCGPPCVPGDETIMSQKEHGTSHTPVQKDLRWGCDFDEADRICNFNRHWAERSGSYVATGFLADASEHSQDDPITFFDSNTGLRLFTAPVDRSMDDFLKESRHHGWPSFRDAEVDWTRVRILPDGEVVSTAGTHLGHNLPDRSGNRYCINLVSVAGNAVEDNN